MADDDAWKRKYEEYAAAQWKKGQADALRRQWADVTPPESSAADVESARKKKEAARKKKEAARKKKQQRPTPTPTTTSTPAVLADMRRLLVR